MKTVLDIYKEYNIMPILQLHQLRVASVAKIICEKFDDNLDKQSIIRACLFHDMGNIIKSDLNLFPESREPMGIEYWEEIKNDFIKKYGKDEHIATELIAKEMNLSPAIIGMINNVGFSNLRKNELSDEFENKICNYSDMRACPYGITSIEERIIDGQKRYKENKHSISSENFELLVNSLENIQKQIFQRINMNPEEINDEAVKDIIEELKKLSIN